MERNELEQELDEFRKKYPKWGKGKLRDIDEDLRQRQSYRNQDIFGHDRVLAFSELDQVDEEGKKTSFEPMEGQSIFNNSAEKNFQWRKVYEILNGFEAVIIFLLYDPFESERWTQEQVGDYFGVSQPAIAYLLEKTKKKLKKHPELLKLL